MKTHALLITTVGILTLTLAFFLGCSSVAKKLPEVTMTSTSDSTFIQELKSLEVEFNEVVGVSASNQKFYLGGFSGLFFSGAASAEGKWALWTLTDRGPNGGEIAALTGVGRNARPFLLPKFSPRLVKLELDNLEFKLKLISSTEFSSESGVGMSGIPITAQTKKNRSYTESAADSFGNKITADSNGMDSEGVCADATGNFWVVEEYGPDILKFNSQAKLIKRFRAGKELPQLLLKRKMNRGFEGVACSKNKVYAILQSPVKSENLNNSLTVPLVEIDLSTGKVSNYNYILENEKTGRIGDITILPDGNLLVLEQNGKTGKDSQRKIYKISLVNSRVSGKELVVDLSATEMNQSEKIEGLAALDRSTLLLISDNDFGMNGEVDLSTGLAVVDSNKKSLLYRLKLRRPMW